MNNQNMQRPFRPALRSPSPRSGTLSLEPSPRQEWSKAVHHIYIMHQAPRQIRCINIIRLSRGGGYIDLYHMKEILVPIYQQVRKTFQRFTTSELLSFEDCFSSTFQVFTPSPMILCPDNYFKIIKQSNGYLNNWSIDCFIN